MSVWDGFGPPGRDEDGDEWEDSDDLEDDDAPWRGDLHASDDWPEELAGPTYEMWKELLDKEDEPEG